MGNLQRVINYLTTSVCSAHFFQLHYIQLIS